MSTALDPPFTRQGALESDDEGLMHTRAASSNEQAIDGSQRTL